MFNTTMILRIQGYWAVGSGKGGGNEVDNRIDRDSDGLPYVPGKMLKGLIKEACIRLQKAGNKDFDFIDEVFGSADENSSLNRTATKTGKLFIITYFILPQAVGACVYCVVCKHLHSRQRQSCQNNKN